MKSMTKEVVVDAVKVAPPVGITVSGIPISDIVAVLTIVYLVLQISYTTHKFIKERKDYG